MKLKGQCLCGAVRYAFEGDPLFVFLCHCRDCQQSSGSLVHYGVIVPEAQLKCEGELRAYSKRSDAGREITREFCPTCGSGIGNRLELLPGAVVIKGGTLDDPSALAPTFEVFARSKASCVDGGASLRSFSGDVTVDPSELMWKAP